MEAETETLGTLLQRCRRQAGLTQEELAERAGVSAHSVSDIERGVQQRPYVSTLRRLADALGLAPEPRVVFLTAGQGNRTRPADTQAGSARGGIQAGSARGGTQAGSARGVPGTSGAAGGSQRQARPQALPGQAADTPVLAAPLTNLPDEPTPFIGREREIAAISSLLKQPPVRLVTLTGSGGVGKTRLALQVASTLLLDFRDGIFFVSLASLTDPTLVPSAIARTLGVKEQGGTSLTDTLRDQLQDSQLLLVLDNFEHLLDAAATVAELLDTCRELHILVTSRIPLHLVREHEYPVPPLSVPDLRRLPPAEILGQCEAVALFLDRTRAVQPEFAITEDNGPAVAEICARLDGLPLALELAATRIKLFPPRALLRRLESRLQLLTGGERPSHPAADPAGGN
jgi:DNA-binding XRE family transcriptional regulator